MIIQVILLTTVLTNQIRAVWATILKERQMVREGGQALPTSSYVQLTVTAVINTLLLWGLTGFIGGLFPAVFLLNVWGIVLVTLTIIIVVGILTTIIKVLVMTGISLLVIRHKTKQLAEELGDKEAE